MATLTIRDLDDSVRDQLRVRAARHGRSMEAEVREILAEAVSPVERTLYDLLMDLRGRTGGVDLDPYLPDRADPERDPFA
ncbi:MAG: Arc family DNA-binding protein [Actinomycetales bacterium]|nr:Arc family DNA-binding protein [Actinomycetales bacterium]